MGKLSRSQVTKKIKNYILSEIMKDKKADLKSDTSLLNSGVLNSLSILLFSSYVEKEFNVKIDLDQIDPSSLRSIDTITDLIFHLNNKD